jgi:hypothetical protein
MAESYIDPNLLAWQKSNVEKSLEPFVAHEQELKDKRLNYEKLVEQRKAVIGVAEGLANEYGPQGDKAPSYIHKFLKKAESNGGVGQLATDDINKFLMTHKTVQDETAFKQKIDNDKATAENHRAQAAQAVYNVAAAKKEEEEANALRNFLLEAQNTDVTAPKVTKEVALGAGVKNVKALGNNVAPETLSMLGLDAETGLVLDKETFDYARSLDATELAERFGLTLNADVHATTEAHIEAVRNSFIQKVGLTPEQVFDVGGIRKTDSAGRTQPTPPENWKNLYSHLVKGNTVLGQVPLGLKPANFKFSLKDWSVTEQEAGKLQTWVKSRLLELGLNEEATVAELTHNKNTEEHQKDKLALSFDAVMITKKVEQEVSDATILARMRYQKAVANWKAKGLTPPVPEQAYIASIVPQTVKNVPNFGPDGNPDGTYKTYFNQGTTEKPVWIDATGRDSNTKSGAADMLVEIKAQNQIRARTIKGQFGDIVVDGTITQESDNEGKSVAEVWEALTSIQTFNDNIDGLIELQERVGPVGLMGINIEGARMYNVLSTLSQAMSRKELVGTGAMTEDDQKRLNVLFQNPSEWQTWFSADANIKALKKLKGILQTKAITKLQASGVRTKDGQIGWGYVDSGRNSRAKAVELLQAVQGGAKLNAEQQKIVDEYKENPN